MFIKYIAFALAYACIVAGFASAGLALSQCCAEDRRLSYEHWADSQDGERIYAAEKNLFPNGQYDPKHHRRLQDDNCFCNCGDGSPADGTSGPATDCTCCPTSSTLEDAIESLSKTCIKSQYSIIMKFRGVFAKTSLLLAVKLNNVYKKKLYAEKASKILGCPNPGSDCYNEACEHIDSAISAFGPSVSHMHIS